MCQLCKVLMFAVTNPMSLHLFSVSQGPTVDVDPLSASRRYSGPPNDRLKRLARMGTFLQLDHICISWYVVLWVSHDARPTVRVALGSCLETLSETLSETL
jgi:hypothetical protein